MRSSYKTIGLWVILICLFVAFYQVFQHTEDEVRQVSFTALMEAIEAQKVAQVRIKGTRYQAVMAGSGERVKATGPQADAATLRTMEAAGVDVVYLPPEETSVWTAIMTQWMPVAFVFLFVIFFLRRLQTKGAKLPTFDAQPQSLPDPGPLRGLDEPRARLRAAADGLKNSTPGTRRVLLSGAPGTGKTALIKAAVADSGLKALVVAGSEFNEVFVGTGAKRVREMFEAAKKAQPIIVVLEDLDAVAKLRTPTGPEKAQEEREQTLLELCQWLDGLKTFPDRTLLIATTNRLDLLDPAILRPGRFQVHIKLRQDGATVEG